VSDVLLRRADEADLERKRKSLNHLDGGRHI